MQEEEAVPINDEDLSDPEVVMLDCTKTARDKRTVERKLRSQAGAVDTQLKALGLYEEGLSFEQKEELLAVVAASRETAQHEESMRLKAKEWQGKPYPVENTLTVEMTNLRQNEKSSSDVVSPRVDNLLQMIKLNEPRIESCSSQELFDSAPNETISKNSPRKQLPDETPSLNVLYSHLHDRQSMNKSEDSKHSAIEANSSLLAAQEGSFSAESAEETSDDSAVTVIQVDFAKQKRELEKLLPYWKPCSSPESTSLEANRSETPKLRSEKAVNPADFEKFLQAIDDYHLSIKKSQRNSGEFIVWGQPITVGRTYVTRSSRSRAAELENSDGVYSFNASGDNESSSGNSMCESYLRLREFSKCLDNRQSVSSSSTLTSVVRTPCQVGKTFLQSTLSMNKNTTSKGARTCLRNVENSVDLTKSSGDIIPLGGDSKNCGISTGSDNAAIRKTNKNEYLVHAEICPRSESGDLSVAVNERKLYSQSLPKSTAKINGTSNCSTSRDPDLSPNNAAQISWDQENKAETAARETSKRRKSPDSLSNFNSPSKRLKEAGTL